MYRSLLRETQHHTTGVGRHDVERPGILLELAGMCRKSGNPTGIDRYDLKRAGILPGLVGKM